MNNTDLMNRLTLEEVRQYIDRAHQNVVDHDTITLGVQLLATMQRVALYHEACGYAIRNFEALGFQDRAEVIERIMGRCEYSVDK